MDGIDPMLDLATREKLEEFLRNRRHRQRVTALRQKKGPLSLAVKSATKSTKRILDILEPIPGAAAQFPVLTCHSFIAELGKVADWINEPRPAKSPVEEEHHKLVFDLCSLGWDEDAVRTLARATGFKDRGTKRL